MSVLQGLLYSKYDLDGTLSFRWSCRMAICGSCGMMINGVPKAACNTFSGNYHPGKVQIGTLVHFPIERDLVIDVEGYVKRLEGIKPYLIPKEARRLDRGRISADPAAAGSLYAIQRVHQLHALLCRVPAVWDELEIHRLRTHGHPGSL